MDILNWIYLKKQKLIRTTANNPDTDLVALGANVGFNKRDDQYQTYAMTVADFTDQIKGYKSYMALVTQTGTDDPEIVELENTLGVVATFSYVNPGQYVVTFDQSLFGSSNEYVTISQNSFIDGANDLNIIQSSPVFFNAASIESYVNGVPTNDVIGSLIPCVFEVRIYNI